MQNNYTSLLPALCEIAKEASALIMKHYDGDFAVTKKADHSPVTLADTESNTLIVARLEALTPDIPVVSEEGDQIPVAENTRFWLVDPLDGTVSYVARDGQFTVNIALIENGQPILGVLAIPAEATLYFAAKGEGAHRQNFTASNAERIQCRIPPADGVDVVTSKSHGSPKMLDFLAGHKVRNRVRAGSALKFCRVAEGVADIYPRMGETMEWDTAAGHCILEAAGGVMTDLKGQPIHYGKKGFLNVGFIAWGHADLVAPIDAK